MSQTSTSKAATIQLEAPRLQRGKALLIAGVRSHYTSQTLHTIPEQWQRFAPHIGKIPRQVGRAAYGLNFLLPNGVDYISGVEVASGSGLSSDFTVVSIPAQKYAIFIHRAHVAELQNTCRLIADWLPASGYEPEKTAGAPDFFERYTEEFDPRTGMGGVEVWVPIKP
jgi:AraC family transcriptional regulator